MMPPLPIWRRNRQPDFRMRNDMRQYRYLFLAIGFRTAVHGDYSQTINVNRRARKAVQHRNRESADAMQRDRLIEGLVNLSEE
jgi:hypothetical protein